jgi:hypothetical protein
MHGNHPKVNLHQRTRNKMYEHRLSEARFPIYGLLTNKGNVPSVHLEFPCRHCSRQSLGPYILPPRLTRAVCHYFLRNFLPDLLQDVDLQPRIRLWFVLVVLHHIFSSISGVLKRVSGKIHGTRWISSMACSLP